MWSITANMFLFNGKHKSKMHFFFQVCSHSCILFRKHFILDHVGFVLGQIFVTTSKYTHKPNIQQILHWRLAWGAVFEKKYLFLHLIVLCYSVVKRGLFQRIIYMIEIYRVSFCKHITNIQAVLILHYSKKLDSVCGKLSRERIYARLLEILLVSSSNTDLMVLVMALL